MVHLIDNLHLKSGIVCDLLSMRIAAVGTKPELGWTRVPQSNHLHWCVRSR